MMHQTVKLIPLTTSNKKENVITEGILDKTCRFVLDRKVNTNILNKTYALHMDLNKLGMEI